MTPDWIRSQTYYTFQPVTVKMPDGPITVMRRWALGTARETAAGARLLAQWGEAAPDANVLVLHCGDGRVGAAVAPRIPDGRITMLDPNAAAVACAQETIRAAGLSNVDVAVGAEADDLVGPEGAAPTFDVVLAQLPKSRAVWEQTVLDAARVLRPGGTCYLAGPRRGGIKTAGKFMAEVFGEAEVMGYKAGSRCLRAVRADQVQLPPGRDDLWREHKDQAGGLRLRWWTRAGVFSLGALDDGTRRLIDVLADGPPAPESAVLDFGCGCGVVLAAMAQWCPTGQLVGADVDCRAVAATRRTLAAAGVAGEAVLSDCAEGVADRTFDLVVTNPPFHQGQRSALDVAEQFIRDSARLLRPGGRLVLVANAFLNYGRVMKEAFAQSDVVSGDGRFKVWVAQGAKKDPGQSRVMSSRNPRKDKSRRGRGKRG